MKSPCLRTPVKELTGHTSVVSAADWMPNGDQIITASWDRTATLFDLETGELVQSLGGNWALIISTQNVLLKLDRQVTTSSSLTSQPILHRV